MKIVAFVQTEYLFIVCGSCTAAVWILAFLKTSVLLIDTELHDLSSSSSAVQPWVDLGLIFMIFTLPEMGGACGTYGWRRCECRVLVR